MDIVKILLENFQKATCETCVNYPNGKGVCERCNSYWSLDEYYARQIAEQIKNSLSTVEKNDDFSFVKEYWHNSLAKKGNEN